MVPRSTLCTRMELSNVADATISWSEYGERFIAAIERGCVSATQFHPEKSSDNGARLIKNWAETL